MKSLLLSILLLLSGSVYADSVFTPPATGSFNVVPEPVTCNGATQKLLWNGSGWFCGLDAEGANHLNFEVRFIRTCIGAQTIVASCARGNREGYGPYQSGVHNYYAPHRVETRTITECTRTAGGRTNNTCIEYRSYQQTAWFRISPTNWQNWKNQGINVWHNVTIQPHRN